MNRLFIRRRLDQIAESEHRNILQQVAGVDAVYRHGQDNSSRWILERAHAIARGMRDTGTKMTEVVQAFAVADISAAAEEAGKCLSYMSDSLIGAHRHRSLAGAGSS